ncbi:MAG: tRNA (adenosine(37)-N6)-threonylcarbamoyltransferase complex dimerization subunit type 1 TsaB [Candidatus Saccharimonadales bacterium]
MKMFLDTSSAVCNLILKDGDQTYQSEWNSGRDLARGLLSYIKNQLEIHNKNFSDLDYIAVKSGPGSFTGLRIGLTVANTLADINKIPIVSGKDSNWIKQAEDKVSNKQDEKIVLPFYNSEPNITISKK